MYTIMMANDRHYIQYMLNKYIGIVYKYKVIIAHNCYFNFVEQNKFIYTSVSSEKKNDVL